LKCKVKFNFAATQLFQQFLYLINVKFLLICQTLLYFVVFVIVTRSSIRIPFLIKILNFAIFFVTLQKISDLSRKFIIRFIAFLLLYVAAASYIFKNETRFFYSQDQISENKTYELDFPFEELWIPFNSEMKIHALWVKKPDRRGVVLYFPGSNYTSGELNESQKFYYQLGYDLIIPDYRNTGKSTGKYQIEEDIYSDAQQWLKMANSLSDSLAVILVGQDFGSGIAAQSYPGNKADLLILEEPYYSWNQIMLRKYFWWLPHSYFTQFEIPVWQFIRASSNPVVLIHPTQSKEIKYRNSEILLEYLKPGDLILSLENDHIDYQSKEFLNKFEKVKLP